MAEFVSKSNFFEFNYNIKQQISGTAIGRKCDLKYGCKFMGELKRDFLQTQDHQLFLWLIFSHFYGRYFLYLDSWGGKTTKSFREP